jgi:hypothetical protein
LLERYRVQQRKEAVLERMKGFPERKEGSLKRKGGL